MIAAIALGANLPSRWGDPAMTLGQAVRRLCGLGEVIAISSFHETEPVGLREQPRFTNGAALLRTALSPPELMRALLALETDMGRVRSADTPPKGPRILDLDLLLCVDEARTSLVLDTPDLILPHPAMHERRFVLLPLAEIAPEMLHPVQRRTVREMLNGLPEDQARPSQKLP